MESHILLPLLDSLLPQENPPHLSLMKRSGTFTITELNTKLNRIFFEGEPERSKAFTALVYLWHDHGSACHEIVQGHEGHADHDVVHAIFHRREGDFSNSKYWFDQAGYHPGYQHLENAWKPGVWKPRLFVDAVRADPSDLGIRAFQALEMRSLAQYWLTFASFR